jgi:hypothetical protein
VAVVAYLADFFRSLRILDSLQHPLYSPALLLRWWRWRRSRALVASAWVGADWLWQVHDSEVP